MRRMHNEPESLAADLKLDYSRCMSTTLRDFIANRKGEIRDQLKALKAELKELQVAEAALDGQEAPAAAQASGPTIKDMARAVLADQPEGLTSQEILVEIKARFEREIDRTSLSPQLSRLKDAGEVGLLGEKWFAKPHFDQWMADIFGDDSEDLIPHKEEEDDSDRVPF